MNNPLNRAVERAEANELRLAKLSARTEIKKAKIEGDWLEMRTFIVFGFLFVVLVLGVAYISWMAARGLNTGDRLEREARQECAKIEGTFIGKIGEEKVNLCIGPNHREVDVTP